MSEHTEQTVDVGAILAAVRADVRAQRLARGESTASPIERELQRSLDEIELNRVISAHWPLQGRTLPQRVVALINKVVRRYLRWYINPIVEQQNAYNDAVARALRVLADAYADLASQGDGEQGTVGSQQSAVGSAVKPSTLNAQPSTLNLQSAIAVRATAEPPARFPDLELQATTPLLHARQNVSAHWPLHGRTAPQRAIALINKMVRRYLRWYINPIVEQQNAANTAITVALIAMIRLDAERRAEAARARAAAAKR